LNITVRRKELLALARSVSLATAKGRRTLPILGHLRMEAHKDHLNVRATNLDVQIEGECSAVVAKPGAICLEAKVLVAALSKLKDERIMINGSQLKTQSATIPIPSMSADEFPPSPEFKATGTVVINKLSAHIAVVQHAMATDDSRPVLRAMLFDFKHKKLVAADGFRLEVASVPMTVSKVDRIIVDRDVIRILQSLKIDKATLSISPEEPAVYKKNDDGTDNIEEVIKPYVSPFVRVTGFSDPSLILTFRPVSGTYPNYPQLIPKPGAIKHRLAVNAGELKTALATLFPTRGEASGSIMRMIGGDGMLRLSTKTDDDTDAKCWIAATGTIKTAVNPIYLLDVLAMVSSSQAITIKTINESSPIMINTPGRTSVIMPMFVQWPEKKQKEVKSETEPISQPAGEGDPCSASDPGQR